MYHIIILTARPKIAEAQTIKLLKDLRVPFEKLIMKPSVQGDNVTYKVSALKQQIMLSYDVAYIFDDDEWNIEAFRKLGLNTVKVDPETGDFKL